MLKVYVNALYRHYNDASICLSVCLSVCMSLCVCICVCMYLCVCLCVFVSVCMYLCVCICVLCAVCVWCGVWCSAVFLCVCVREFLRACTGKCRVSVCAVVRVCACRAYGGRGVWCGAANNRERERQITDRGRGRRGRGERCGYTASIYLWSMLYLSTDYWYGAADRLLSIAFWPLLPRLPSFPEKSSPAQ